MATESLHTKACSALVVFLFPALVTGLLLVAIPALASDVVFVDHGSVYDPPASSDKAYYPSVLYDESQFSGRGAPHYYKMWYADAQGQDEAVTYSDDGMSWSSPVQTTGIMASGYHAKVIYIPGGYSAVGGTYYYKIWYWDSSANVYSINALRTADSADGENWHNDQILTQDVIMPLVTGDPSNWSAGSYGPVTILYHPSAANAGSNPFDYTFSMYYDATTGGQEAVALGFSTDGNHWTRYGNAPVLPHGNPGDWDSDYASHGTVIKGSDGTWRMWYSGSGPSAGGEQGIGYATSADGINWTKDPGNPIFSIYQAVAWRSSRCYTPSVLYRSTRFDGHGAAAAYKMWFTGEASATGNRTIGYADAAVSVDLTLTKSDGGATVAPGGTVAYTLTYGNAGTISATGVTLTETVPANSIFNAGASTAGWVCTPNNNAGSTCTLAAGTVTAGAGPLTATFAVTATNPLPAGVTQISNTASIADDGTHGSDVVPGNNTGSDTTPVVGAPDLSLTKSDGGASVAPGGTVAYTLTFANSGNRGASGVVLTETVPANSAFNAGASTAGWVCTPNNNAGSTCTLAVGGLSAGSGNQTSTFAVTVVNPVAAGVTQISNTASIADDGTNGTDPTPGNNTGSDTTPLTGAPDLSLTKSDGGASVAPGGTVAYTLTYSNSGNRGASGVVLTETVPANSTVNAGASTAGWVCAPNNNAGSTCTLAAGTLAAGGGAQTATFAVTVINPVAAGVTQIANTATIADNGANGADSSSANNTASDTTPLTGAPDLSVAVSDGGTSAHAADVITYTLTYANNGNRGAASVVITDTVPANTTFNPGGSTAGWACAPNNNAGSTCTLAVGTLPAGGGSQTAAFAVTVVNSVPGGVMQFTDAASIQDNGANGADPTPANNSASDFTPFIGGAVVFGTKTVGGSFMVGGNVTYTVVLTNSGAGTQADNPGNEFIDVLPAQLALVSATATSGTAVANTGTGTVTWNGSIPAGASVTITITATVQPVAPGAISNQGSIAFDSNGDGTNESTALTDDPSVAGAANPTAFTVVAAIPMFSIFSLMAMAGLLAVAGFALLRRS